MMETEGVTIGIDNGLDGGLCALSNWDGSVIDYHQMPTFEIGGKREVDPFALSKLLGGEMYFGRNTTICVEEPLKHAKTSQSMRSMGISFGKIEGVCSVLGHQVQRIQVLDWQKAMLGKVPKGKTKEYALRKAMELWPSEMWLATARSRTPHDGIIDAALIAKYHISLYEQTRHNAAA